MARGRRAPEPSPALRRLTPEEQERAQERFNRSLSAGYSGLPAPHGDTHGPNGGDPLPAGSVSAASFFLLMGA